ncbi:MAG: hypothetical protein CME65_10350 [Halobacteriovoraceae bacterium]|nr:hypothetical protein [Halobacteriovoraceae bacterium]|tara:strand:- start:10293 stop:10580 length:288 start_codon:yes stop_codon:yes gene_type:complete
MLLISFNAEFWSTCAYQNLPVSQNINKFKYFGVGKSPAPIFQARFDGKDLTFLNHSETITEGYLRVSFYIFLHFSEFGLSVACFWLACFYIFQSV